MNKFALLLSALLATSSYAELSISAPEIKLLWDTWKSLNNKVYAESEEITRFTAFVENYLQITIYNSQHSGVKLALNEFADLTEEEFEAQYGRGLLLDEDDLRDDQSESNIDYSILALPESVDWRAKGAVTSVKSQGHCGSCWAFATTGALEGFHFIKTGELLSFSEQQLIDCDTQSHGCGGGFTKLAFDYAAKNGMLREEDYPYKAKRGACEFSAEKAHHTNGGHKAVKRKNADALKAAIVTQPVHVSVHAANSFRFYKSGVVKDGCAPKVNHGVLAVGYTVENGEEAFIIKNSWGAKWGNKGYILISTDKKANDGFGVCGILTRPTYPTA